MAQIGMNFNARQYEPAQVGGGQLPVSDKNGWPVVITESEMKQVKDKVNAGYLELTFQIIDGEHRGEEGKYRLNLFNDSEQTVSIAYKQLSALCHVTGVFDVVDSAQLHNKPFRAVVGLQRDKEAAEKGYTEVKGVLDINGNQPGKGQNTSSNAPAPAPSPAPAPAPQPAPAGNPGGWAPAPDAAPAAAAPSWANPPAGGAAAPPWAK